jgi:hypothetical protein
MEGFGSKRRQAEFADIVYDIDHGCLTSYDDVGFTPHSDR